MSEEHPDSVGRFLTVTNTAAILNVPDEAVVALLDSGELPAIRVGSDGPWRIERAALETYIEALYEESRRHSLWLGSDIASISEISAGKIIRDID